MVQHDSGDKTSYDHNLNDTGRTDDEGNPIYQCPLCGGDFQAKATKRGSGAK